MAETGRSCWGRGQQDASDSEADAGSRNPGSVTEGDGEGYTTKHHSGVVMSDSTVEMAVALELFYLLALKRA